MRNSNYHKSEKLKPKTLQKVPCNGTIKNEELRMAPEKGKSRRLRCPECKKNFMTGWRDCHYNDWPRRPCWHETFPPHYKSV